MNNTHEKIWENRIDKTSETLFLGRQEEEDRCLKQRRLFMGLMRDTNYL